MPIRDKYCIAGVGNTRYGKLPGRSAESLTVEAIKHAIEDCGIAKSEIDAVLTKAPTSNFQMLFSARICQDLGIVPAVTATLDAAGASTAALIQYAAMCIEEGLCHAAVVSYGDNPITGSRETYARARADDDAVYGMFGAPPNYAMIARRYMHEFGLTDRQLGSAPISDRAWAAMNDNAVFRAPITHEDRENSRYVVEPFHLLDCCPITDGAAAAVVVSAERARDLKKPPVYLRGFGQGHPAWGLPAREQWTTSGAKRSAETAYRIAGLGPLDMDVLELYDPFSIVPIISVEDYGFCKKGEGGAFLADGKTRPGGSLPMNTSGGLLSETGMPGMQLIVEAVRQLRGECGERQVANAHTALVSNQGGVMTTHATLILRSDR
ncbi:MAG TPA: thiolase family protein [Dehalococcoidia bacterium]